MRKNINPINILKDICSERKINPQSVTIMRLPTLIKGNVIEILCPFDKR